MKKPLKLNGKKTCDTSIACCNVAHIFGSIFHVNAIKVRFCSWKNTKRKCIKQTCTYKEPSAGAAGDSFPCGNKSRREIQKIQFVLHQSIKKAKLKVCEKSFQLCCYTNLQWPSVVCLLWRSHYAECRMHHRIAVACLSIKCYPNQEPQLCMVVALIATSSALQLLRYTNDA